VRFGFSLANLSLGLVRHHRPALHDPFTLFRATRISALTIEAVSIHSRMMLPPDVLDIRGKSDNLIIRL